MDFAGIAHAMGTTGNGGAGGAGGGVAAFLPLILMVAIFYFLLIRPQQKKQKEHRAMLQNIQKGDVVLTNGGIQGTVVSIADNVLTVEIAERVRVKVGRNFIAGIVSRGEPVKD